MPPRDIPGPGKYADGQPDTTQPKNFNAKGEASIFLSKVPNCKDAKIRNTSLPGPGHYSTKAVKHGDPSEIGSKAVASTNDNSVMSSTQGNGFLSNTTRGDFWKNELNAPFTNATF